MPGVAPTPTPDPDLQAMYAELRSRGIFTANPDLAGMAQELVKRGVLQDLSGGSSYASTPSTQSGDGQIDPGQQGELQDIYASLRQNTNYLNAHPEVHDILASLVKDGTLHDLSGGSSYNAPTPPITGVNPDVTSQSGLDALTNGAATTNAAVGLAGVNPGVDLSGFDQTAAPSFALASGATMPRGLLKQSPVPPGLPKIIAPLPKLNTTQGLTPPNQPNATTPSAPLSFPISPKLSIATPASALEHAPESQVGAQTYVPPAPPAATPAPVSSGQYVLNALGDWVKKVGTAASNDAYNLAAGAASMVGNIAGNHDDRDDYPVPIQTVSAAAAPVSNSIRNFAQGATAPGIARFDTDFNADEAAGNQGDPSALNVLGHVVDPRYIGSNIKAGARAVLNNSGDTAIGKQVPSLSPGTTAGDTYNTLTAMGSDPVNLALAPNGFQLGDIAKAVARGDLSGAGSAIVSASAAAGPSVAERTANGLRSLASVPDDAVRARVQKLTEQRYGPGATLYASFDPVTGDFEGVRVYGVDQGAAGGEPVTAAGAPNTSGTAPQNSAAAASASAPAATTSLPAQLESQSAMSHRPLGRVDPDALAAIYRQVATIATDPANAPAFGGETVDPGTIAHVAVQQAVQQGVVPPEQAEQLTAALAQTHANANDPANLDLFGGEVPNHATIAHVAANPLARDEHSDLADLARMGGGMADGITGKMYDGLWNNVQNQDILEGGKPSALLQAASVVRGAGGLQSPQEFRQFAQDIQAVRDQGIGGPAYQSAMNSVVQKYVDQAQSAWHAANPSTPATGADSAASAPYSVQREASSNGPTASTPSSDNSFAAQFQGKPLYMMSRSELDTELASAKQDDKALLDDVFGPAQAQVYRRLQSVANSTTRGFDETHAASVQAEQMEDALPPEKQRLLFQGYPDSPNDPDHVADYVRGTAYIEDAESPEALGTRIANAVTTLGDATDPATMTHPQQVAYAQLRLANETAQRNGWDGNVVSQAAINKVAQNLNGDPDDIALMLGRYWEGNNSSNANPNTTNQGTGLALNAGVPINANNDGTSPGALAGSGSAGSPDNGRLAIASTEPASVQSTARGDLGRTSGQSSSVRRLVANAEQQRPRLVGGSGAGIDAAANAVDRQAASAGDNTQVNSQSGQVGRAESGSSALPANGSALSNIGNPSRMPTKEIGLREDVFQFRRRRGVADFPAWNQEQADKSPLGVWRDVKGEIGEAGKTYVVNGHNRALNARKFDVPDLAVRHIKAGTAREAREAGALENLMDSPRNDALDVASFLRDSPAAAAAGDPGTYLRRLGVATGTGVIKDALSLAKLPKAAFDAVVRGSEQHPGLMKVAAAAAESFPAAKAAARVTRAIEQLESGQKVTPDQIAAEAKIEKDRADEQLQSGMLFDDGSDQATEIRGRVVAGLQRHFGELVNSGKKLGKQSVSDFFGVTGDQRNLASLASQVKEIIERTANRSTPLGARVSAAVEAIRAGGNENEIIGQLSRELESGKVIGDTLRGGTSSSSGSSTSSDVAQAGQRGAVDSGGASGGGEARSGIQGRNEGSPAASESSAVQGRGKVDGVDGVVEAEPTLDQAAAINNRVHSSGNLNAGLPIGNWIDDDLKPAMKLAKGASEQIKAAANPASSSDAAGMVARTIRAEVAKGARKTDIVDTLLSRDSRSLAQRLKAAGEIAANIFAGKGDPPPQIGEAAIKVFDRMSKGMRAGGRNIPQEVSQMSPAARSEFVARIRKGQAQPDGRLQAYADLLDFQDRVETGRPQTHPALQSIADMMRNAIVVPMEDELKNLPHGAIEHFLTDYFPHYWDRSAANGTAYSDLIGGSRRPLEGPASFKRERTIPTTLDGIERGLIPATTNPAEAIRTKYFEVTKYVAAHYIIAALRDNGLLQRFFGMPATGYSRIDDKFAKIIETRDTTKADGTPGAPERILRGEWSAPDTVANVINNHLSAGLQGPLPSIWKKATNTMTSMILSLSGYHGFFTGTNSMASSIALGIESAESAIRNKTGNNRTLAVRAAKFLAKGATGTSIPSDYMFGKLLRKEWMQPGSTNPEIAALVNAIVEGGGRAHMDSDVSLRDPVSGRSAVSRLGQRVMSGNLLGATGQVLPAAAEASLYPIMEKWVPYLKLAATAHRLALDMADMPANASVDAQRKAFAATIDSMDNRYGQLVWSNLLIQKWIKDLSQSVMISPSFTLGTVRELGGAKVDALATPFRVYKGGRVITRKMAYQAGLFAATSITGALLAKALTNRWPKDLKDAQYPEDGTTKPDGKPGRLIVAGYQGGENEMADAAQHGPGALYDWLLKEAANKVNPIYRLGPALESNKDYFGRQIADPNAPMVERVEQKAKYVASQYLPISVAKAAGQVAKGDSPGKAMIEGAFGLKAAPSEIGRTPAERLMYNDVHASMPQGDRTPAQQETTRANRTLRQRMGASWSLPKAQQSAEQTVAINEAVASGLSAKQIRLDVRESVDDPRVTTFAKLPADQALDVYEAADADERKMWQDTMIRKVANYARAHGTSDPVWKRAVNLGLIREKAAAAPR